MTLGVCLCLDGVRCMYFGVLFEGLLALVWSSVCLRYVDTAGARSFPPRC